MGALLTWLMLGYLAVRSVARLDEAEEAVRTLSLTAVHLQTLYQKPPIR